MNDPHEPRYFTKGDWKRVSYHYTSVLGKVHCNWSDGAYHATVSIPSFLYKDSEVFIIGRIRFLDQAGTPSIVGIETGVPFVRNLPPTVSIDALANLTNLTGMLPINGTSSDDEIVTEVQVSIDGGPWAMANGTSRWTYILDCDSLPQGTHTISVRAFDGTEYSHEQTVEIDVHGPYDDNQDDEPLPDWLPAVIALCAIGLLVIVMVSYFSSTRRRGRL